MKLLNNDRLLIPSIVTHVFFSFIIISCIIGFLLTQKYSENVIITSINFTNLTLASMIVGIIVKQKWKYRVYKTSPIWLTVFTFKLITTPGFEMFMSNYSLNIIINFILSVVFFITLVTKRLFLKYFIIGMIISVILTFLTKYIVLQKDIEQYYFFLQNEVFIIFSCVVKILGILILIYYRQIEEEVKIETLRTFSNVIAHEIFTPLALMETILGVVNASTAENETKETILSLLKTCRNTREKINFLIDNTKLIGDTKSFSTTSISVREVLAQCIEEYQSKDFNAVFVAHNDIQFFGCKNIMRCIICNILNNAFQHGGENTKVEVLISGNYLIFQDNGNGIKTSNLNSIFDVFSTSTKHNLGIGLTICKDIIKSYGGEISCISLEGSHATFIIKFPII